MSTSLHLCPSAAPPAQVQGSAHPRPTRESAFPLNLKGKGRSYSSPFPLVSALDLVPLSPSLTHSDVFVPLPLALTFPVKAVAVEPEKEKKPRNAFEERPEKLRSAFEEMLPREVRLHVFACLVHGREEEHVRRIWRYALFAKLASSETVAHQGPSKAGRQRRVPSMTCTPIESGAGKKPKIISTPFHSKSGVGA